jgi:hypothetical protein
MRMGILMDKCSLLPPFRQETFRVLCLRPLSWGTPCSPVRLVPQA